MTELEKLMRAEMYIRKMAEGINPITDENACEYDMVNNVRITRCLYYVSDVLKQVIANEGVVQKKSNTGKKSDFYLTDKQRDAITVFNYPVYVKELVDKINKITEDNKCKKFASKWITEYLVNIGMLFNDEGSKCATQTGKALGIISERRRANYMPKEYWVNLYTPDAQRFIIDNLDAIIEFSRNPQCHEQTHPNNENSQTEGN